jgi:hypothetical protein
MPEGLIDDIAVLEEYDEMIYRWHTVAYIGFSRADGDLEIPDKRLRIRYLKEEDKRGKCDRIDKIDPMPELPVFQLHKKINEIIDVVNKIVSKKDEVTQMKLDLFELINSYERKENK